MKTLRTLLLLLVLFPVLAACIDRPDFVLAEDQMVDVLVDVHRAEGLLEIQQQTALRPTETEQYQREVIAAVLQQHGVSRVQYDSSLMWYAQHLRLLTRVYQHVDERLQAEHDQWGVQVAEATTFAASEAGDSVDVWPLRRHQVLDALAHTDARFWEIPSDSNFVAGDTLHWQFCVRHLRPGQRLVAAMSLAPVPEYDERGNLKPEQRYTPLGYCSRVIAETGRYHLTVFADTLVDFKSMHLSLVVLHDSASVSPVFADSIVLVRCHAAVAEADDAAAVADTAAVR